MDFEPTSTVFVTSRRYLDTSLVLKYTFFKRVVTITFVDHARANKAMRVKKLKRASDMIFLDMVRWVNLHLSSLLTKENQLYLEMMPRNNLLNTLRHLADEISLKPTKIENGPCNSTDIKHVQVRGRIYTGKVVFSVEGGNSASRDLPLVPPLYLYARTEEYPSEVLSVILEKQGLLNPGSPNMKLWSNFFEREVRVVVGKDSQASRRIKARLRLLTLDQLIRRE